MKLKLNRKLIGGLVFSAAVALTGCAGSGIKDGSQASETEASYREFLNNPPSFETVKVGNPAADLALSALTTYRDKQFKTLQAVDSAVEGNLAGYKVAMAYETLEGDALAKYKSELTEEDMVAFDKFNSNMSEVVAIKDSYKDDALKVALAVINFDQNRFLDGANLMQMNTLLKAFATGVEQAKFIQDTVEWQSQYEGVLENAKNDLGR